MRDRPVRWFASLVIACWIASTSHSTCFADDAPVARAGAGDVVLKGGTIIDGTGQPARAGDVAIRGDRIVAIGSFPIDPEAKVIDVSGLIIAPGFIDLHTHSDDVITKAGTRLNLNYLTQGVTTIVTGNCGMGPIDATKYLGMIDARGAGTNVIHLIPQGSLRNAVLGTDDRAASQAEMDRMKALVAREMAAGAWGTASGLIYVPSRYASTAELIELAKIVGAAGGIYASHIRDEEDGLLEAVDEAITIGKEGQVRAHISHLKANGRANWGKSQQAVEKIEAARKAGQVVTADQYPYLASSTSLAAMVVPHWAIRGTGEDFAKLAASERGELLRVEIQRELDRRDGGATVRIARYGARPDRVGRDLVTIAQLERSTPLDVVIDVQSHGGAQAINFGMSEDDVRFIMGKDYVATASDGSSHLPGRGDRPHPRAYGTFPRKIRYAIDDKVIGLEQAVRANSGLPAEILGLPERGTLREGAFADIVVFDPKTFRDAATFEEPTTYAGGIHSLFVNGVAVLANGKPTMKGSAEAKLPGRALRLQTDGPADLILSVGRIWTGDAAKPWAEAVAVRSGQVAAVGSRAEMDPFKGPLTRLVDRPQAFATPGLIDAHGHITSLGETAEQVDLRDVRSLGEVVQKVRDRMTAEPGDGWIHGVNWDQSLWHGGEFPTAAILDGVAPDRPVWLRRVDGHAGWANSEAMRRAGITKESKAPSDGQIVIDAEGNPTGVFVDGAMGLITAKIPAVDKPDALKKRILNAQKQILAAGLTGVHDAGISRAEENAFRDLDHSGQLRLRVYAMASPPSGHEVEFVSRSPVARRAGARFEMRAVKLFIDGAMGSRGALLFESYHDDPKNKGLTLIDPSVLEATVTTALKHHWQVATHAIGDRGNALVLDAYASAMKKVPDAHDPRLRIEHAQVVRKEDVPRFAASKIIASMQPSHASTDKRWADARLGPGRVDGAYAWQWFREGKAAIAFGSDFPVEIPSPFWGLYAAVTRQDASGEPEGGWHPDQRLALEDALRYFTTGSAHASFDENRLGVLKPGYRADLTIVDRDLFNVLPKEMLESRVVMTVIDGEIVYEAATKGH